MQAELGSTENDRDVCNSRRSHLQESGHHGHSEHRGAVSRHTLTQASLRTHHGEDTVPRQPTSKNGRTGKAVQQAVSTCMASVPGAPIHVLVTPCLTQLPGKATALAPNAWALGSLGGDLDGAPGFRLQSGH